MSILFNLNFLKDEEGTGGVYLEKKNTFFYGGEKKGEKEKEENIW